MTKDDFDRVLEERFEKIRAVLHRKSDDYSTDHERLLNFKTSAKEWGSTPEIECWSSLKKHLTSVLFLVFGGKPLSLEAVDEKIGDAINYLILLEAIFREKLSGTPDTGTPAAGTKDRDVPGEV